MLNFRQLSTLPSDTKRNLREHVKAITLKGWKELNNPTIEIKNNEEKQ